MKKELKPRDSKEKLESKQLDKRLLEFKLKERLSLKNIDLKEKKRWKKLDLHKKLPD